MAYIVLREIDARSPRTNLAIHPHLRPDQLRNALYPVQPSNWFKKAIRLRYVRVFAIANMSVVCLSSVTFVCRLVYSTHSLTTRAVFAVEVGEGFDPLRKMVDPLHNV